MATMANALKKITTEAKRLRKKNPRMTWRGAVKAAGLKYRKVSKKKKAVRPARVTPKKTYKVKRSRVRSAAVSGVSNMSTASLKGALRTQLKNTMSGLLLRKELSKTKREKSKIAKQISAIKRQLKNYE